MYVLHHADRPELYHGLPNEPEISPVVSLWKGFLKPLSTFGIAASLLFGFFHYITVGPNRADDEDDGPDDQSGVQKTEQKEETRS